MMRSIDQTDFETNNVEFIEFGYLTRLLRTRDLPAASYISTWEMFLKIFSKMVNVLTKMDYQRPKSRPKLTTHCGEKFQKIRYRLPRHSVMIQMIVLTRTLASMA